MNFLNTLSRCLFISAMCVATQSFAQVKPSRALQPIVIQGALPIESERMVSKLSHVKEEKFGGWSFWKGEYQGYLKVKEDSTRQSGWR